MFACVFPLGARAQGVGAGARSGTDTQGAFGSLHVTAGGVHAPGREKDLWDSMRR